MKLPNSLQKCPTLTYALWLKAQLLHESAKKSTARKELAKEPLFGDT